MRKRDFIHFKKSLSIKYGQLAYTGLWFSATRDALDSFFKTHQGRVSGEVRFRLSDRSFAITGRKSQQSIYDEKLATYSSADVFNHESARGFIELWGLPNVVRSGRDVRMKKVKK